MPIVLSPFCHRHFDIYCRDQRVLVRPRASSTLHALRPALSFQNLTLYDAYDIFLVPIFYCANFNILILSIFNMKSPRGCVDTIVSTYLYIDYYSIIWINYYLCFVLSEAKMMATQRHPTRRASRVARSKCGPRVITTVEYKMAVMLFWSLYIFACNIYFSCNCVCVWQKES
jgi:hypothetical protein